MLTYEQILTADDLPFEIVPVPEWGGDVRVKSLDASERDEFEQGLVQHRGKSARVNLRNIRAKLVARTVVDEAGAPLFTDADVQRLAKKSARAMDRIFAVAQRLAGLSKEDVEELAKNSESGPDGDSPSD